MQKERIDFIAERLVPEFYVTEGSNLVPFLQAFILWLNKQNRPFGLIGNMVSGRDIDKAIDEYLEHLKNELAKDLPISLASDTRLFLKNVLHLYRAKGSIASFEYFFRTLYDASISITYPKDYILKPSDGRWYNDHYLYCGTFRELEFVSPEGHDKGTISSTLGMRIRSCDVLMDQNGNLVTDEYGRFIPVRTYGEGFVDDIIDRSYDDSDQLLTSFRVSSPSGYFKVGSRIIIDHEFSETYDYYYGTLRNTNTGEGFWAGKYGQLSEASIVLQDSYYWQDFSYVLSSTVPFEQYQEVLKKLLHPAGLQLIGDYQMYDPKKNILHYWGVKLWLMMAYKCKTNEDGTPVRNEYGERVYEPVYQSFEQGVLIPKGTIVNSIQTSREFGIGDHNATLTFEEYIDELVRVCETIEDLYQYGDYMIPTEDTQVLKFAMQSNKDSLIMFDASGEYVPEYEIDWVSNRMKTPRTSSGTWYTIDALASNFYLNGTVPANAKIGPAVEEDFDANSMPIVFYRYPGESWKKLVNSKVRIETNVWDLSSIRETEVCIYQTTGLTNYQSGELINQRTFEYKPDGISLHTIQRRNIALFLNGKLYHYFEWDNTTGTIKFDYPKSGTYEIFLVNSRQNVTRFYSDGTTLSRNGYVELTMTPSAKITKME